MENEFYPSISLVTPSLNRADLLEKTIKSVVAQNYPALEYIIVDGGSTDDSVDIIKKYEKYISYWCSEPDNGMYDALKKGFAASSGELMGWINSDDILFPWTLHTVASIFKKFPEVNWLSSLYPCVVNSCDVPIKCKKIKGYSKNYFHSGLYMNLPDSKRLGFIQQESTYWLRSLYDSVGGIQDDFRLAGDFDLWTKFYKHAELVGVEALLGGIRYHGDQLSCKHFDKYLEEVFESLRKEGITPRGNLINRMKIIHMDIMAKYPKIKCPSLGLLQPVKNIVWDIKERTWKIKEQWI